jgi:GNAT superfamily N-acetyltransferase
VFGDIPALQALIADSTRGLSAEYRREQIEATLDYIYGVDTELLEDQSYFVVEYDHALAACGGWSRRKTLFGGDGFSGRDPGYLNPATDPAKIRAFFVHPGHARRGLGRLLLEHSEAQARAHGFARAELMATLPGIPLYTAHGYQPQEPFEFTAPNGVTVPFVKMAKTL